MGKRHISRIERKYPHHTYHSWRDRAIKKTIPDLGWEEEEVERRHWREVVADWNINIDNIVVEDEVGGRIINDNFVGGRYIRAGGRL